MVCQYSFLASLLLVLACSSPGKEPLGSSGGDAGSKNGGAPGADGGATPGAGTGGMTSGGSAAVGGDGGTSSSGGNTSTGGSGVGGQAGAPGADTCESISATYNELVKPDAQTCTVASDCHLLSGHCFVGLGGCHHVVSTTVQSQALDELHVRWVALSCMGGVCDCPPPPAAVGCSAEGRCVEQPVTVVEGRCCCEFLTGDIIEEDLKEPAECTAAEGHCVLVDPGRLTPHACCPGATGATCGD